VGHLQLVLVVGDGPESLHDDPEPLSAHVLCQEAVEGLHLDVAERASRLFDRVTVAVLENPALGGRADDLEPLFDREEVPVSLRRVLEHRHRHPVEKPARAFGHVEVSVGKGVEASRIYDVHHASISTAVNAFFP